MRKTGGGGEVLLRRGIGWRGRASALWLQVSDAPADMDWRGGGAEGRREGLDRGSLTIAWENGFVGTFEILLEQISDV